MDRFGSAFFPPAENSSFFAHLRDIASGETALKALELFRQCRFREARDYLLKAMELYSNPPRVDHEDLNRMVDFVVQRLRAIFLGLLGDIDGALGNLGLARDHYQESLRLAEKICDDDVRVKALQGLGVSFFNMGDYEQALTLCHQALDLLEQREDIWQTRTKILTSLGVLYSEVGQYDTALRYAQEAVDLSQSSEYRMMLPQCLNNLGYLYMDHEDYPLAIEVLELGTEAAWETDQQRQGQLAVLNNNLGMCYLRQALGPASAQEKVDFLHHAAGFFQQTIDLCREMGDLTMEGLATGNLGLVWQSIDCFKQAGEAFEQSVSLARQVGARAQLAVSLANLGRFRRDVEQDYEGACLACQESISLLEGQRGGLKRESHRVGFADQRAEPYDIMVECLLKLNRPATALEYVERAKSRALVELLSAKMTAAANHEASEAYRQTLGLLTEMEEIRATLESVFHQEETLQEATEAFEDEHYTRSLLEELTKKERAFEAALAQLNVMEPERASLLKVMPISLGEVQGLLDEETALLIFYQSESQLSLFVVARWGLETVLTLEQPAAVAAAEVQDLEQALRDGATLDLRSHDYVRRIKQPLSHFYEFLVSTLESRLEPFRRLILAPHLFWHYVPFHALYDRKTRQYLGDRFEIGYCPSASVLKLCQEKQRWARDRALILSRNNGTLPHVDQEAEALAEAFSPNYQVFQGEAAHLGLVQENASYFDVIHLACHGRFHLEQPFLSGLDIPPGRGEKRNTFLPDLFRLRLDCSLVTLSACDSGLSRFTGADDLIGLSRGLFYAGASAVLLSLWQVADASTCYLMENFYWHYSKNRQTKTRALQLAMQAVRAKPEYAHPYYWAPFVVMGDWL